MESLTKPSGCAPWNRFCSNSDKVVFNKDGYLHCRALKNPKVTSEDPGEMITGGIKSLGKHDFLYGRIEARIKTNLHTGTFPAFWLMPTNNIGGWPHGGEIDIWEVINNEDRAYGTVHMGMLYHRPSQRQQPVGHQL